MTDIVEFLTARLDEDEATAKAAGVGIRDTWHIIEWHNGQFEDGLTVSVDVHGIAGTSITSGGALLRVDGAHIARHDPARVLREVAAKREHLRMYVQQRGMLDHIRTYWDQFTHDTRITATALAGVLEAVVRQDAAVYADHPDYNPAWRVS
jgi:hypothetical protein